MKTHKRRFEALSFYDHTGVARHLEDMARRGWLIERISNYYWTYRRIQPQELQFSVTYYPKASEFDPAPSEGQQRLLDFCAETGWELACTWFQMQIFYNMAANPIPINTDPVLEVDTVHRACKANYIRGYILLLVIGLIGGAFFVSSLISDTLRIIASPADFTTGMFFLSLFVLCGVELLAYYTWYRRAKKAAEHEIFLDTPSTSAFQKVILVILLLCVVYWMVNLIFGRNPAMAGIAVMVFAAVFATILLVDAVRRRLRRKGVSSGVNRFLTILSCFAIYVVLMGVVVVIGVHITKEGPPETLPLSGEPPLRVEDLMAVEYSGYVTEYSPDGSLLLTRLEVNQRHGFEDEPSPDIPELHYELFIVRVPALYNFCENQMKRLMELSAFWKGALVERDPAPWGADRAYRLVMDNGTEQTVYLLCYGDRLAQIQFNWPPTADQMAIAGERLAHAQ